MLNTHLHVAPADFCPESRTLEFSKYIWSEPIQFARRDLGMGTTRANRMGSDEALVSKK